MEKGTGWKVGWILKVVAVSYTKELELLKWLLSPSFFGSLRTSLGFLSTLVTVLMFSSVLILFVSNLPKVCLETVLF